MGSELHTTFNVVKKRAKRKQLRFGDHGQGNLLRTSKDLLDQKARSRGR
jgi:hypothetical protein